MLKLVAAVIFFLEGLKVIESTAEVTWWLIALGILAVGLVFDVLPGTVSERWRTRA